MVLRDLQKTEGKTARGDTCRALSASLLAAHAGDDARVEAELHKAVQACRDSTGLSADLKMTLAKTCFDQKMPEQATDVMVAVLSNSADARSTVRALAVFKAAGRNDLAEQSVVESRRVVSELVSGGADRARQGDLAGAVALMTQAASQFPDNAQVVFNAALACLKLLEKAGWENDLGKQARFYIAAVRRVDPNNAKLAPLCNLYDSLALKYGVRAQLPR